MSNLNLQFIAEFLRVEPLTSPPVKPFTVEFDPSGLLEETQFSLWWLLQGLRSPSQPLESTSQPTSKSTKATLWPLARLMF